jgi:hypothetical protein
MRRPSHEAVSSASLTVSRVSILCAPAVAIVPRLNGDPLRTLSVAFAGLKICSQLHSSKSAGLETGAECSACPSAPAAIGALDLTSVASFFQRKSVRYPAISLPFCRTAAVLRSFFQGLSSVHGPFTRILILTFSIVLCLIAID